ncbi:MAG TPA: hypothetical protein VN823_13815 [Stellaceae bacterium]|nr:hypothetical protein [Stellaceae bacterium]
MLVAMFTTFAASRKEPLADMVGRVHAGFLAAGFGEPTVRFTFSDPPAASPEMTVVQTTMGTKPVSSIERVLKRWPELGKFARDIGSGTARGVKTRILTNLTPSGVIEPVDFAVLKEIAQGVPRSFPFRGVSFHFSAGGFSEGAPLPTVPDPRTLGMLISAGVDIRTGTPITGGVTVQDSWWVNGRQRSLQAMRVVEADPAAQKLPPPPESVAAVLAACGKARKTIQIPLVLPPAGATPELIVPVGVVAKETAEAIRSVVQAYRAKMTELLEALPHDLPHEVEAGTETVSPNTGLPSTGPKKPDLIRAFAPLGYDCRGESGTLALQRRTPGNLAVTLHLDVGTWFSSVTARMQVIGLKDGKGFRAPLSLPVSRLAVRGVELPGQFPIGNAERWGKIVDNLATLVAALDRSFVPEIEAITGPSPAWFKPEATS